MSIVENTNYRNKNIQYVKNVRISEWDIHNAGLSVIKWYKLLPDDIIEKMERMDKHSRTVFEGKLQKDNKTLAEKIITGLANVRKAFVIANNINENNIISIKKDAIFLINSQITTPAIKDTFVFREKNKYSSYIYLNGCEFYLKQDGSGVDIKGISSESREHQKKYFLKDISRILSSAEKISPERLYLMLKTYRSQYLNRKLPIETYRDLKTGRFIVGKYTLDCVSDDMINDVDISQNYLNYIIPMISLLI